MPELSIVPKLSRQQIVVCRPHTLVCNHGDRRSNAQDTAISGERFSPSYAIHLANERRVRPSGDQDEDFAPPISSRPPRQQADRLPRPDQPLGVRNGPVVPPPPALKTSLGRRELFRTLAAGTAVAAVSSVPFAVLGKNTTTSKKPQRARYQPNSPEVQTFYRVNRYPQK
jgi:hypothetical protein